MPLGPVVRSLFGRYERQIGELYRAVFIDLDALIAIMRTWQPTATNILEVGCGEGAVTERLRRAYPNACITAIDITPRIGRLYRGAVDRVRFLQTAVEDVARREPGRYDFAVLADVVHHIPVQHRRGVLDGIRTLLAPSGLLVFKDWARAFTPIHWMSYASDRWLTGDRIRYLSDAEMRQLLATSFGATSIVAEARVAPWSNNVAFLVRPPAP
jgi:2-polyprenyl-6-hydroxyphenyl methylase/3-demethylubiquinone-9 3-methyltransferase